MKRKPEKFFNENIWNWNFLFKLSPSDHLWCTWQSGRLPEGFAYEKSSLWAGVVFFPNDHKNQMLQIGSGWVQLTPDNSNPRLLEPPANSDQNRFSLDFLHTFNVILPSVTRTSRFALGNTNLPLTRNNFLFPLRSFLYKFTLDNSNHVLSA